MAPSLVPYHPSLEQNVEKNIGRRDRQGAQSTQSNPVIIRVAIAIDVIPRARIMAKIILCALCAPPRTLRPLLVPALPG